MNFKVNSKELEKALSKVFPAVPTKTPVQILENFYFDISDGILSIYGTDLELAAKTTLNIVADGNFRCVISARRLYDTIRSFNDTIVYFDVLEDTKRIKISWEKGEYLLSYISAQEFPEIPTFPSTEDESVFSVSINGRDMKYAIEKTLFAVSKESFRPAMMGVLFEFSEEGLRFVSTDGHRLISLLFKNYSVEQPESYVVSSDVITILQKVLDDGEIKMFFTKSHIAFRLNDIEIIARLIDERYPDYKSIIPLENEFEFIFKPSELLPSVKRVSSVAEALKKVNFNLVEEGDIEINTDDSEMGNFAMEKINGSYKGEDMIIAFNGNYLIEILSHLSDIEQVSMKLRMPNKPVLISPVDEEENRELTMLLMPLRLNV